MKKKRSFAEKNACLKPVSSDQTNEVIEKRIIPFNSKTEWNS